jgi:predicted amidophosphoribosyltransferase
VSLTLTRIDPLILGDHYYLTADDECYFLREYTARGGFAASETNQIIHNLKKPPDRRSRPEWFHKERALERAASELRAALNPAWLRAATMVPIPPHVAKGDPLYDDRVLQIANRMSDGTRIDVRELVVQIATVDPSHQSASRPRPNELRDNYRLDEGLCDPAPATIGILDDILTAGAHFRAIKDMLSERFPAVPVLGIFYARRIVAPEEV